MKKLLFLLLILTSTSLQCSEMSFEEFKALGEQNQANQNIMTHKETEQKKLRGFIETTKKQIISKIQTIIKRNQIIQKLNPTNLNIQIKYRAYCKKLNLAIQLIKDHQFKSAFDSLRVLSTESNNLKLTNNYLQNILNVISNNLFDITELPNDISDIITSYIKPYKYEETQLTFTGSSNFNYSPDNKYIVVSYYADDSNKVGIFIGGAKIVDSQTGELVKTLEGTYNIVIKDRVNSYGNNGNTITQIVWSPNGLYIAACSSNGIFIWDVNSGKLIKHLEAEFTTSYTSDLSWSNDSSKILGASFMHHLNVYDLETNQITTINEICKPYKIFRLPDSNIFAITGLITRKVTIFNLNDNSIKVIYDSEPAIGQKRDSGHNTDINTVAWSKNGILAFGDICTIKLYKLTNGSYKEFLSLEGHERAIGSLNFSQDSSKLVSASWDGRINIWDVNTGEIIDTIQESSHIYNVQWTPCGNNIIFNSWEKIKFIGKTLE